MVVQEVMVEVEVRAAQNVLEACAQTVTMERVVFTSSVTAVVWKDDDHKPVDAFDERNWSDLNLCRKRKVINQSSAAASFFSAQGQNLVTKSNN